MDILSHGLWGAATVGRKSKRRFWTAFAFGIFPDAFAFGLPISHLLFSFITGSGADFIRTPADGYADIPAYVFSLYDISHSLVVFTAAFFLVWALRKHLPVLEGSSRQTGPLWEMLAWGLHIVMDIFTHSDAFFPTPFLWPISDVYFNGYSWGNLNIFIPNVTLLAIVYAYWWYRRLASRKSTT